MAHLISTTQAIKLTAIPRSSFRLARKEGHFRGYFSPDRRLHFKYDEVLADAKNFWTGGKPNHEPEIFLSLVNITGGQPDMKPH